MKYIAYGIFVFGAIHFAKAQNPFPIILKQSDDRLKMVMLNEKEHELQLIYTQIRRNKKGTPSFKSYRYGNSKRDYFYPASTVKLPLVLLTLEKINSLREKGIGIASETPFIVANPDSEVILVAKDSTHPRGQLSLAHQIKKLFLVSDNQAYNFLFDFLGQNYINTTLKEKGYQDIQLNHKFSGIPPIEEKASLYFIKGKDTLYTKSINTPQPQIQSSKLKGLLKGKGVIKKGTLLKQPMNFSAKNRASLEDLHQMMKGIIFPEQAPTKNRFNLTGEDLKFIRYWMSRKTTEVEVPNYKNDTLYWDSYVKFFLYGDKKGEMNPEVRIYNKVGSAYGTLTDVAFIQNEKEGIEFFLAATILVNQNQIFNDDLYEYDTVGIPFLAALGEAIYTYELKEKD